MDQEKVTVSNPAEELKAIAINPDAPFEENARIVLQACLASNVEPTEDNIQSLASVAAGLIGVIEPPILRTLLKAGIDTRGLDATKRFVTLLAWNQVVDVFGGGRCRVVAKEREG